MRISRIQVRDFRNLADVSIDAHRPLRMKSPFARFAEDRKIRQEDESGAVNHQLQKAVQTHLC